MKKIILFFIISVGVQGQDLKVFDIQLGKPMDIRECNFKVYEFASKDGIAVKKNKGRGLLDRKPNISKMYMYTENTPQKDKCYQRVGLYYTEIPTPGTAAAENLTDILSPNNQKVKLIYPKDSRPGIADREDIWIGIQNNKITGVKFYFNIHNAKAVYQTLVRKYNKPTSRQNFSISTPAGNNINYYETIWDFSNLKATFLSIDTNQIGYDPNNAPIGYSSDVGSVTIQYYSEEKMLEDKNKL